MNRLQNGDVSSFARFMARVSIPNDARACWTWTGGLSSKGYGEFSQSTNGKGRNYRAHRWMFAFLHGPIPTGMVVRHKCDNPSCVSPHHLELGTQGDNYRDMVERQRKPEPLKGENSNLSRFTSADVLEMRRLRAMGWTHQQIGDAFKTSKGSIYCIVSGRRWAHLPLVPPAARSVAPQTMEIAA